MASRCSTLGWFCELQALQKGWTMVSQMGQASLLVRGDETVGRALPPWLAQKPPGTRKARVSWSLGSPVGPLHPCRRREPFCRWILGCRPWQPPTFSVWETEDQQGQGVALRITVSRADVLLLPVN